MSVELTRATWTDLFARVEMEPNSGCWLWIAGRNPRGYGVYYGRGPDGQWTRSPAHHVAYFLSTQRTVPQGMYLCHRCDTPPCINPAHLFQATPRGNMLDAVAKDRLITRLKSGDARTIRAKAAAGRSPVGACSRVRRHPDADMPHRQRPELGGRMTPSRAEVERIKKRHEDFAERYSPGPDWEPFNQTHQDRGVLLAALLAAWDALGAVPCSCRDLHDPGDPTCAQAIARAALPRAEGPSGRDESERGRSSSEQQAGPVPVASPRISPRAEGPQENPFHFCPWIKENLIGPASKCEWREHHEPRAEGEAPKEDCGPCLTCGRGPHIVPPCCCERCIHGPADA